MAEYFHYIRKSSAGGGTSLIIGHSIARFFLTDNKNRSIMPNLKVGFYNHLINLEKKENNNDQTSWF